MCLINIVFFTQGMKEEKIHDKIHDLQLKEIE